MRKINNPISKTKEYTSWRGIIARCTNIKNPAYSDYGGRGIIICPQWRHSYSQFLHDVGKAPSPKHSIDRIDNDGNYEPGNVKWATSKEQCNNRRSNVMLTMNGMTKNIRQWSDELNISYQMVRNRVIKLKWTHADALTIPNIEKKIAKRNRK